MPLEGSGRAVVAISNGDAARHEHCILTLQALVPRIAKLLEPRESRPQYVVPASTLTTADAQRLDVRDESDLFGGVVPYAFVATKVITHAVPPGADGRPDGWCDELGKSLADVVLPGYSAFTHADAHRAACLLLEGGPVRCKRGEGIGGGGQGVIRSTNKLDEILATIDASDLRKHGLVLEKNLEEETTYSVGEIFLGGMRAAYWGTQQRTRDHAGQWVYGGSDLHVARGSLADLVGRAENEDIRRAIRHAVRYDAAVFAEYPDAFASRRNYDVAVGYDARGDYWCGVLEQSWRIGGASAAEIAALESFNSDPRRHVVRVSTHEVYELADAPEGAHVHYRGTDPVVGCLTKYSRVHPDGHSPR